MKRISEPERIQTVVIGGGQAGLSVGYHLARRGLPFVILDASKRVGDAWRSRWDSLRLFTPARYDGLAGMKFPAPGSSTVTKDQMGDYLESYAKRFKLPVRSDTRVQRVSRNGHGFMVEAGGMCIEADNVVVAMSNHQCPRVPAYAKDLDSAIVQLHSSEYKNPSQLQEGGVLIVGVGNSGAEIAMDVASRHQTWVSGRDTGHVPFRIDSPIARHVLVRIVRFIGHRVLTVKTPIGRKVRPKILHHGGPLVRVKPKDMAAAGIERVPRTAGVKDGLPVLEDGRVLDVANVIWATGYTGGFSWIRLPVFDEYEYPEHNRGIVEKEPGLYFVGLQFLYAESSSVITGVDRDAKYVVKALSARMR